MKYPSDISGNKYGNWLVLEKREKQMFLCRCVCGVEKIVNKFNLIGGKTKSCGCAADRKRAKTHGMRYHPLYQLWKGMKARCYSVNHKNYKDYGGRGIEVCPEWKDDFAQFVADMDPRPSKKHSLDRIDTNGPYSPENCRWATQKKQCRNRRRQKTITYQGKTASVAEWSEITGIDSSLLYHRLAAGWSDERALTT